MTVKVVLAATVPTLKDPPAITAGSVVMNTSLNGPGEPIVESPEEALAFLRGSGVDVLYLDGFRVERRGAAQPPADLPAEVAD